MVRTELIAPPTDKSEVRVNTRFFYGFYSKFLDGLKDSLPGVPRWIVSEQYFHDGTPNLQIIPDKGVVQDIKKLSLPFDTAFVPFWYLPSASESGQEIEKIGSALSHVETSRSTPLATKRIGICPYAMLRKDQDSMNPITGDRNIGEAIYSEIFANKVRNYFTDLLLLSPHSKKALEDLRINYLSLSAISLFVDWFNKKYPTEEERRKVKIAALDKGGLQGVLKFVELAGLDPKTQVIVFDKKRSGEDLVDGGKMLYGNPKGADIIVLDDIIDTAESAELTIESLKKRGANKITLMATHGVLSFPASDRIKKSIELGLLNNLVLTNSLPQAQYGLEELGELIEIIDVAPLMAYFARYVSNSSIKEIRDGLKDIENPLSGLSPFIMEPRDKQEVWQEFIQKVEHSPKSK